MTGTALRGRQAPGARYQVARSGYGLIPQWVPRDQVESVVLGDRFDVVRMPQEIGRRVIAALGKECGMVLASRLADSMDFLVEPGVLTPGWRACGARLRRADARLSVPPAAVRSGRDVHWAIPPGRLVATAPSALLAALGVPQPN
ncbi:hypothetical protein [Kitasatospora sp. MBT63]|uniref:hypothetical protein n=1 Tax=Kitasatospora sp. MBT63 TaxID=1444768 RepID=UPI000539EF8D|nr:hypothetical protein [Kitasatospora sp. MBT63]